MNQYRNTRTGMTVEALQLTEESVSKIVNWTQGQLVEERNSITGEETPGVNIKTPAGRKRASLGAFVVWHNNRFFIVDPDVFTHLYEEVKNDAQGTVGALPKRPKDRHRRS